MGIIIALLMLNPNPEVNIKDQIECIRYMSTIKIGGLGKYTQDERLAASYQYCTQHVNLRQENTDSSVRDYVAMFKIFND